MGHRRKKLREKELEGVNLMGLAPRRIAEWEEAEGRVTVLRPHPGTRGWKRVLDRILNALSANRIRLDEMGSFAWRHLDGNRTVQEVAGLMREEFGVTVEPVEARLGHLIWLMRREGFLVYPGWDEDAGAKDREALT